MIDVITAGLQTIVAVLMVCILFRTRTIYRNIGAISDAIVDLNTRVADLEQRELARQFNLRVVSKQDRMQ